MLSNIYSQSQHSCICIWYPYPGTYDGFANLILFIPKSDWKNLSNWAKCVNAYLKWKSIAPFYILSTVNSFESILSQNGSPNGTCYQVF